MKERIHSIDIVRGLIMIIMTLDHSRDFFNTPGPSPLNMETTTVILFFTRWVTCFCVALVVLSGLPIKFTGFPLVWQADGFGYPLWTVYLFWLSVIAMLYFPCKWYGNYKRNHTRWWLSYI